MLRHLRRTKNTHTIVWQSKSVCSWKSHCRSLRSRRRQHNTPEPIVKDIIRRRGGSCDDTTRTPCTHGVMHLQKATCKYTRDTRDLPEMNTLYPTHTDTKQHESQVPCPSCQQTQKQSGFISVTKWTHTGVSFLQQTYTQFYPITISWNHLGHKILLKPSAMKSCDSPFRWRESFNWKQHWWNSLKLAHVL